MRRFATPILSLLLVTAVAVTPVQSQTVDSTLVARFQLAESYVRAAQFERAIELLQDLVRRAPDTGLFVDRLREAYESVKRYDDAIALIDLQIDASRTPARLLAERARLLYLAGREEEAFETWSRALESQPGQAGVYLAVMRSQMQLRLFDRAAGVLEEGRQRLGNEALYRADLAFLYSNVGRHADAASEYVAMVAQNPAQSTFVRSRMARHFDDPDALGDGIGVLERAVRERPLDRAIRELLAWMYVEAGRFADALDANRAIDRLENEQGRVLLAYARQATDAGAFEPALEAYSEILERYPDAPSASDARSGMGRLNEARADSLLSNVASDSARTAGLAYLEAALESYDLFLARDPGHPDQPEIRYRRARVLQDHFFRLGDAEAALEVIVSRFPASPAADRAELDMGRIQVLRGELDGARLRFMRLADRLRTGELAEAARYELALLHFYRGEFDAARAITESMKENTAADVANDAIGMKLLLVENRGPDSLDAPLRSYARILLLERQRNFDSALALADSLTAAMPDHALLDDLHFLRADLLHRVGRSVQAALAYRELPLVHPDSPHADRSLFAAAELYERILGDPDTAIETWSELLRLFPGSLLAAESRARIRAVRGDGV